MRARLLRGDVSCAAPPLTAGEAAAAEGEVVALAFAVDASELDDKRLLVVVGLALVLASVAALCVSVVLPQPQTRLESSIMLAPRKIFCILCYLRCKN